MPTKVEKLLDCFQSNAFPAMLEDLGSHLGVSADSLRRLAVGWAPIVTFKKGANFQGWWVVPERDSDATPLGLSLRSQSDFKAMYPGSKHGLIFEVNPEHECGANSPDQRGHWIRTMEAGVLCPICGKPDGCLVNAANPSDPAGDAICIRTRDGAVKEMEFGFLHCKTNFTAAALALANNGGPVVCVEGMSDTAAAMDLGFDGVGRPSNLACMDMLRDLVRGRDLIIIGENDKKPDGKHPGYEGMVATWQATRDVCKHVSMILPPEYAKDLRAWKNKYKLTSDALLAYVQENEGKFAKPQELVLPDPKPLTMAKGYLRSRFWMAERPTIRRWQSTWYRYVGAKYESMSDEAFRQPVYGWADDKQVVTINKDGRESLQPLVANNTFIANLTEAVMSETLVEHTKLPCWINRKNGPDPKDLIVFSNGILHVPAFLGGDVETRYLIDSTPDLFTTVALPFAFDPTAECPTWKRFLRTSLGDDDAKIRLLREWFGYCMTPDTSMQKLLFMRGPSAAGKSVVLNVLCRLVGEEQAASTSFADLANAHGMESMIGKMICIIPDARTPRHGDSMRGLELLLNITAGDPITINPKFKPMIARLRLMARISIASNEFLEVPDHAGAMQRRLNLLEFTQSFVGREDFELENKLAAEIPGIAVWALDGLKRLRDNGRFTVPNSSQTALREWRTQTSPIASFLEECTDAGIGEVLKMELFDCWERWATERRIPLVTVQRFFERIKSNATHVVGDTYEKGGHKFSVFRGLTLKPWAAKKFLGKMN